MCGISGIIASRHGKAELHRRITGMNRAMRHRGPDGEGVFAQDGVALGHVRLAIIDLSDAGSQPMANEDESLQLVINGEIYNYRELRRDLESRGHRFRSQSDSEVVLHLYEAFGDACLNRLDGMFALALWDQRKQRLLLARDRFGIKPLYYAQHDDGLLFASELGALMASGMTSREIDRLALYGYMALSYVPSPLCMIRGVNKLLPGQAMVFEQGRCHLFRYWSPRRHRVPSSFTEGSELLHTMLQQSVRTHLESDVPVAAFLSGGVDSSLISALARKEQDLHSVCAAFPGNSVDESAIAREVAVHVATRHHEVPIGIDPGQLFSEASAFFDEPFADSSALPTFAVCRAGREIAKVMLSGDGGDEAFGGYTGRYRVSALKARLPLPHMLASLLRQLPPWRSGRRTSLPQMLDMAALDEVTRYLSERQITTLAQRKQMFPDDEVEAGEAWLRQMVEERLTWCDYRHPVHRALWLDLNTSLGDDMLTKVDRMSMAHGLEVRVPLLDHRVVEFALSCPPHWLVSARAIEGKRLLRRVAAPMLPDGILDRPKQGFVVPLNAWLDGALRDFWQKDTQVCLQEVLEGEDWMRNGARVESQSPRQDHYALLVLGQWLARRSHAGAAT